MKSVLINILTSLVVGSVTFVLGLKTENNQSDRRVIKERYKKLYLHFNEMLIGLNSINPKKWEDFKAVESGLNRGQYMPIVKEMIENGDTIELNKKFVTKLMDLEFEILKYGHHYNESFLEIENILLSKLREYCSSMEDKKYEIVTKKDTIGWSTTPTNMGIFIVKSKLDSLIKFLNGREKSGVSFKLRDNRILRIYNDSLDNMTLSDFFKECYEENIRRTEVVELLKSKDTLIEQTNDILKQLDKRVKEPFPFWKTFFGAFIDVFKN